MLAEGQIGYLASLGVKVNSQTLGSAQQRLFATSARRLPDFRGVYGISALEWKHIVY